MPTAPSRCVRSLVVLVALILPACTTGGDDVVFDEQTLSTQAPTSTVATTAPPTAGGDTSTTITTEDGAAAPESGETTPTTTAIALSEDAVVELPGRLAIGGSPPTSITVLGTDLSPEVAETATTAAQPSWSPDGTRVAWAAANADGSGGLVVSSLVGDDRIAVATPYVPFYIQWRPDGQALAVLGGTAGGTGMVVIDLADETIRELHSSPSFYFHWSPDGTTMISHLDNERLELIDVATGEITSLEAETANFQAPEWTIDGSSFIYVRRSTAETASQLAQAAVVDELVMYEVESGESRVLAQAPTIQSFKVSPTGDRVAFPTPAFSSNQVMRIVEIASGDVEEYDAPNLFGWQWSPDGRKILTLEVVERAIQYVVWDEGVRTAYASVVPTSEFVSRYLAFWGQYDRSVTLWAPDSSAFVYAAFDRGADWILLQRLEDELPIQLLPGGVAFFSPVR